MKKPNIYIYLDYRKFVKDSLSNRGEKQRAANRMACHVSYLSQVLTGEKNLNFEQAYKLCEYLNLSEEEGDYFFELVSYEKAGTKELKERHRKKISVLSDKQFNLKQQLKEKRELSKDDQLLYYSSWIYSAVHMASTIPALQEIENLRRFLGIEESSYLLSIVENLKKMSLVDYNNGTLSATNNQVYVGSDSIHSNRHHANWRGWVLSRLGLNKKEDLNYTLCFSVSKQDLAKVRENLVEAVKSSLAIIRESKEEKLATLTIDLMSL